MPSDENGSSRIAGFLAAYVFDVSQTDGQEQMAAIVNSAKTQLNRALFALAAGTGARAGELFALRVETDVNFGQVAAVTFAHEQLKSAWPWTAV